jgi:hypothetical protein
MVLMMSGSSTWSAVHGANGAHTPTRLVGMSRHAQRQLSPVGWPSSRSLAISQSSAVAQRGWHVSDRQSAPVIASVRGPAGLDCGRRLRDAHTIS